MVLPKVLFDIGWGQESNSDKLDQIGDDEDKGCTTLCILGKTGTGKSTFCNAIISRQFFRDGYQCQFKMSAQPDSCTFLTTAARGNLLDQIGMPIYVIDTPGLSDSSGQDAKFIIDMIKKLKTINEGISMFILSLSEVRLDQSTKQLIRVFQSSFGEETFWNACSMVYTKWPSDSKERKKRARMGTSEEIFKRQLIDLLKIEFPSCSTIFEKVTSQRIFFTNVFEIDDCYDPDDTSKDATFDEDQFKKLQTYTEIQTLYTIAATNDKTTIASAVGVRVANYQKIGDQALEQIAQNAKSLGQFQQQYQQYFLPLKDVDFKTFSQENFDKLFGLIMSNYQDYQSQLKQILKKQNDQLDSQKKKAQQEAEKLKKQNDQLDSQKKKAEQEAQKLKKEMEEERQRIAQHNIICNRWRTEASTDATEQTKNSNKSFRCLIDISQVKKWVGEIFYITYYESEQTYYRHIISYDFGGTMMKVYMYSNTTSGFFNQSYGISGAFRIQAKNTNCYINIAYSNPMVTGNKIRIHFDTDSCESKYYWTNYLLDWNPPTSDLSCNGITASFSVLHNTDYCYFCELKFSD